MPSNDWMSQSKCSELEPAKAFGWFFPLPKKEPLENLFDTHSPERAKKICRTCPVIEECLEYAIRHNEDGVWGGTTKRERRALKRKRKNRDLRSQRPGQDL